MGVWHRLLRQPQGLWLRKALFQVHLWTGLALGLYIVMLSVTGSALVYRRELVALLRTPLPPFDSAAQQLSADEVRASAQRAYPDHEVDSVGGPATRRSPAIDVTVIRNGQKKERLFDPYTGADLGDSFTRGERAIIWVVRLHDELLLSSTGRYWNGVASGFVTLLVLTGACVWWPGVGRWRRSLTVKLRGGWRRATWDLHGAMGAWLFLFLLMWGVSGFYLGVPEPFSNFVDYAFGMENLGDRPGDLALAWLGRLHFGRWPNGWLKALWALVGLVPALMFVTGTVMWWNRVLRRRPVAEAAAAPHAPAASL